MFPDGKIDLVDPNASWNTLHGVYKEEGSAAYLDFPEPRGGWRYAGSATGQTVSVRWYEYAVSPQLEKRISRTQYDSYIEEGEIEIGDLSNLKLVTETTASASFAWTVTPDQLGGVLLEGKKPSGVGRAQFSKKPDGSWFADGVSF
jgi:hypothetical protein